MSPRCVPPSEARTAARLGLAHALHPLARVTSLGVRQTLDVMLTPPVLVDFDDAVELDDTFTLTLPHCLHEGPGSKEALVVVYATLTSQAT